MRELPKSIDVVSPVYKSPETVLPLVESLERTLSSITKNYQIVPSDTVQLLETYID